MSIMILYGFEIWVLLVCVFDVIECFVLSFEEWRKLVI